MSSDTLFSDRESLRLEIEYLAQDFRINEAKIDKKRVQYGDVLKQYYNSLEFEQLAKTLLTSLTEYALYISSFTSNMPFMIFNAQQQMLDALEDIQKQRQVEQNLAISIAPGTGKSTMISYFISWSFLNNPDVAFMYLANKELRAKEQSAKARAIIMSEPWIRIGGEEIGRGTGQDSSKLKWALKSGSANSGFEAGSHGNILGGNGGNPNTSGFKGGVICDDFQSQRVMTQAYERELDIETFNGPVKSRRRTTSMPIILNAQRLHMDDLIGYVEQNEKKEWRIVSIPSLIKKDDKWVSADPRAISVEALLRMRDQSPFQFYAMYQQRPIAQGGAKFKEEWITYYETLPTSFDMVFITTDWAYKKGEDSDRTVFCLWGVSNGYLYLIKYNFGRWDMSHSKKEFKEFWRATRAAYNVMFATIEKIKDSLIFKDDLVADDPSIVWHEVPRGTDKVARANDTVPYMASNRILIPKNGPDIDIITGELLAFSDDMTHAHDDIADNFFDAANVAFGNYQDNTIFI